jgi:hypothetical protein
MPTEPDEPTDWQYVPISEYVVVDKDRLGRLEAVYQAADRYCENDSEANWDALAEAVEAVRQVDDR